MSAHRPHGLTRIASLSSGVDQAPDCPSERARDDPKASSWRNGAARHRSARQFPEVACKPGSVPTPGCPGVSEDHSSRPAIAGRLEHSHPDTGPSPKTRQSSGPLSTMSLFKLAPGGACLAAGHPAVARGLLPHDFTLTCARRPEGRGAIGGVISAALSLGSPRVAVNDLPVLWSPDFPPVNGGSPRTRMCSPATFQPPPAGPRILSRVALRATTPVQRGKWESIGHDSGFFVAIALSIY